MLSISSEVLSPEVYIHVHFIHTKKQEAIAIGNGNGPEEVASLYPLNTILMFSYTIIHWGVGWIWVLSYIHTSIFLCAVNLI